MKTYLLLSSLFLLGAINSLLAWEIKPPTDHSKMAKDADLVAIVVVTELKDTGKIKKIKKNDVKYPEVNIKFKILNSIKGSKEQGISCNIYREPTNEELEKRGLSYDEIRLRLINSVEGPKVNLANVKIGDQLLIYLKFNKEGRLTPLTGDSESSSSLHKLIPSY